MRITNVKTIKVKIPLEKPVKTTLHDSRDIYCVLVFLETDEGVTGESYVFILNPRRLRVLEEMILSLSGDIIGEDPHYTERMWKKLWREINTLGYAGVSLFAVSALDMASWDVVGKFAGRPLHSLLGAYREKIPCYFTGALFLGESGEEIIEDAKELIQKGMTTIKMSVGKPGIEEDVERVKAVRKCIGSNVGLMVDANQGLSVNHAIKLGRKLEQFDLVWFEEPVPAYDVDGLAKVSGALDLPIASGESDYTRYSFRRLVENHAVDIIMPDFARVGGMTEFLKVAHLAEAFEIPVAPHIFSEQSLQVLGVIPNGIYLEYTSWLKPIYKERIVIENGIAEIPNRPGFGFTFSEDAIERFRINS